MFLGNLSATTERKARKPKAEKALASESADANPSVTDDSSDVPFVRRCSPGDKKILYREGELPRELLMEYFTVCASMLMDERNIREIINDGISKNVGLHQASIEFQRDVLEYNFQIERNYGCQFLGSIPQHHPDDTELIKGAQGFMLGCMLGYLKAIKVRARLYKTGAVQGPLPNQSMTRTAVLEFFEACNALMGAPETKKELREIFLRTKDIPNARVIEMQRSLLKSLGYHPDFAVSCLNRLNVDYKDDREISMKMQFFAVGAELACQIATFDETEHANFFRNVPPLLHHCPQVYVLQQRMAAHQQMVMQQHMAAQQNPQVTPMTTEQRAQDTKALQNSGMMSFLSTAEGREALQALATKVQASRERVAEDMKTWDTDRKMSFFEAFQEHPTLAALSNPTQNPADRMQVLLSISDADLDTAMQVIVILNTDDSGQLMRDLRAKAAAATRAQEEEGAGAQAATTEEVLQSGAKSQALHNMVAALSSLDNMKRMQHARMTQQQHAHAHGNTHDHDHNHDGSCSHVPLKPRADVSKGAVNSMER